MRALTVTVWTLVLGALAFGCKEPETVYNLTDVTLDLAGCLGPPTAQGGQAQCTARLDEAAPAGDVNACLLLQKQGATPAVFRVPMRWADSNLVPVGSRFPTIAPGDTYAAELYVRTTAGTASLCDRVNFGDACGDGCLVKLHQDPRQVGSGSADADGGVGSGNRLDFTDGRGQCLIEQGPAAVEAFAASEVCDELDNDCDGQVDEGFVCAEDCAADSDCADTPATPVCVGNRCLPCRIAGDGIHDGCGAGELCCAQGETPTCVAVSTTQCTDCATGCGVEADSCAAGRTCACAANADGAACADPTPFCTDGGCVACRDTNDCGGGELCCNDRCIPQDQGNCGGCGVACDITTSDRCEGGVCQCGEEDACGGERPFCRAEIGQPVTCVACERDQECGDNRVCVDNRCSECDPASRDLQCDFDADRPICGANGLCVGCMNNAECELRVGDQNFCVAGTCTECNPDTNAGCDPFSPICAAGLCRPCVDSAECGLGSECFEGRCEGCDPASQVGCTVNQAEPFCDPVRNVCRACEDDGECGETEAGNGDECVDGQCERCDPSDHSGCQADELCCAGADGAPRCVPTQFDGANGCETCGVACNGNLSNVCSDRTCECGGDGRLCRAGSELCDPQVGGGTCNECRGNADCPLDRLCCDGACVPTGPGAGDVCESCAAAVGLGTCDVLSTNSCDDRECRCGANDPCGGATPVCNDELGICVQCRGDADCAARPGTPECVNAVCVECDAADGHRGCREDSATPICVAGSCEPCGADLDCQQRPGTRDQCVGQRCEACDLGTNPQVTNNQQPADGCNTGRPICDGNSRTCRVCNVDAECGAGQQCVGGQCNSCDPNDFSTCGGEGSLSPVCDGDSLRCRGCRNDAECPNGLICTEGDGRCVECDLANHDNCGPNQLCCGAVGEQACVGTSMDRCATCEGAASACDPDATNRCVRRECTCGVLNVNGVCGGVRPFCAGAGVDGECVACRDAADCAGLGARSRCVPTADVNDGLAAFCEVCDPGTNEGCDNTRTLPICRISGGISCSACASDQECADRGPDGRDQCVANGSCQTCDPNDDAGCGAGAPICDAGNFSCRGCRADVECQLSPNNGPLCDEASGACFACDDNQRNGTETGRDCGGDCRALGQLCANGTGCAVPGDCVSGVCTNNVCQAPTCNDQVFNGAETDTDCGGASCRATGDLCPAGDRCAIAADCSSGRCVNGRCGEANCNDGVTNGDETDTDCGGSCRQAPLSLTCPDGDRCLVAADCASGVCQGPAGNKTCRAPTCNDNVRNGLETDTDCGGANMCDRCAVADTCVGGQDCLSGVCRDGLCQMPACNDGVANGNETDVDCGGPDCGACRANLACVAPADCLSAVCTNNVCVAAGCGDGIFNGDETDLDCGGSCDPCVDGDDCGNGADCVSLVCTNGTCAAPRCDDMVQNGTETDLNCGGNCPPCATGDTCAIGGDCVEGVCQAGTCAEPTCNDTVLNGAETDLDCGGALCRAADALCNDTDDCDIAADCQSGVCTGGTCRAPRCNDNVQNGAETDTDCGGAVCRAANRLCANDAGCVVGIDCVSGVCDQGVCQAPTCNDGVPNGDETDTDCGGGTCGACPDGDACGNSDANCQSLVCTNGTCRAPTCNDNTLNGLETGEDCGGAACRQANLLCADGLGCSVSADCISGVCTGGVCQAPTCADNVPNGAETDTDCGGNVCDPCADGRDCNAPGDCESGVCTNNTCQAPDCNDTVQNGTELGVDCGGGCPAGCAAGTACNNAGDCDSGVCNVTCQAPACNDGVQNGDETAQDCGGSCPGCAAGEACAVNGDCATGKCTNNVCATLCANEILDAANGETDVDCGGANCGACAQGQTCSADGDCAAGAPQCVAGAGGSTCEVCDPNAAAFDGCGANQLCCDGGGAPACQNAVLNECTACGAAGACDADRANQCVGRSCQCGADAACAPAGAEPYCLEDGANTRCVECRDNADCASGNCNQANNTCVGN